MNFIPKLLKQRIPLVIFLCCYVMVVFATYIDFGASLDEFFVYQRGKLFYQHIRVDEPSIDLTFTNKFYTGDGTTLDNRNHLFKNSTYPAFLYIFNESESIDTYHLLNALFASLVFITVYEILLIAGYSSWQSVLGPVILFFTPRFAGHIPFNPKDMPYAVTYMGSLLLMLWCTRLPRWTGILLLGLAIGMAASIRQVGFLLIPIYGIYWAYQKNLLRIPQTSQDLRKIVPGIINICLLIGLSFAIHMFTYPYLIADPIPRFMELLKINQEFPWNEEILLFGKAYLPENRPWTYLPIWILVTTPLAFLVFSLAAFKKIRVDSVVMLLSVSLGVNFLIYLLMHPTIYDGIRHYMFFLPHIAVLAVIGFYELLKHKKHTLLIIFILGIQLGNMAYQYISLHPYQYVYFNELVGGLQGAQNDFEREYWGTSDKEAMRWLRTYLIENDIKEARIGTCSRSASTQYYLPEYIDSNNEINLAHYFVCYGRFNSLDHLYGNVLYTVERQGVTLNTVIHVNSCAPNFKK